MRSNKEILKKVDRMIENERELGRKKANIIVDMFQDIVNESIIGGFYGISNKLLLEYVKDMRELANE